jgi:hypothetical protein
MSDKFSRAIIIDAGKKTRLSNVCNTSSRPLQTEVTRVFVHLTRKEIGDAMKRVSQEVFSGK